MIQLTDVNKYYGHTRALDGISLSLQMPGIYCLLGRNGAGKTTLLKLIAGHINASSGNVQVNGRSVNMLQMPEDVHFIESNAAQFNMKLRALFRAAEKLGDSDYEFALMLAAKFKLDLNKRYKQLSFGMKVMVNTILGMASTKKILILDEPVLGFDAVMRKNFYNLLLESNQSKPKTIIISTHLIDEMTTVAGQLVIIDAGRLLLHSPMDEIAEKAYSVTGLAEPVEAAVEGLNVIGETRAGGFVSKYVFDKRVEGNAQVSVANLGLQDFFVSLVGEE